MYKLTPVFPENFDSINMLTNPDDIFPYEGGVLNTEVVNPMYDYVQPQQVSLLLTNMYPLMCSFDFYLGEDIHLRMCTVYSGSYMIKRTINWDNKLLELLNLLLLMTANTLNTTTAFNSKHVVVVQIHVQ